MFNMNAYELADDLDKASDLELELNRPENYADFKNASTMLRQQAKRIEELETSIKVNQECSSMEENKPAAYWDGKHFASKEKSSLADIPLYTHQHKELSDVVIPLDIAKSLLGITEVPRHKRILESAIIKASRGEE